MSALIHVTTNEQGLEVVDSRLIAELLEIEHRALLQTISKHEETIEFNFGRVAFEMLPLLTSGGTQETRVAQLTEDQALFIGALSRNSKAVVQFKAALVSAFQNARRKREFSPMSQLDILAQSIQILQQNQRDFAEMKADHAVTKAIQAEQGEDIRMLQAKTTTIPDYFTVAGYANLNNIRVGLKTAGHVGQVASRICKSRGIMTETCPDPRFGRVNMYPSTVLKEVFAMPIV